MIQCPKCSAENSDDSRFCKSCAEPLSSVSQMPTMEAPESPQAPVQSPHVGRIVSSDSVPAGGFTPGTILADRYRVIGLLGRGGMGEVYRADDLKLGQPVALKFLPPKLSEDPVRRERFFAEVRITRQLSHPNICRVYDIGEVDGRHFLSMEYIDGEDLASLMKRIGSLTNEKALDIARQLVAGLTVAHERGVLHWGHSRTSISNRLCASRILQKEDKMITKLSKQRTTLLAAISCIGLFFMISRTYAWGPYTFELDRFQVEGNLSGNLVDEFDDGIVYPWYIDDPTVVESDGLVHFSNPGNVEVTVVNGNYFEAEMSYMSSGSAFNVENGAGDFTSTSKWVPIVPGLNQWYIHGIVYREPDIAIDITLSVINCDMYLADALGLPPGLSIMFLRFNQHTGDWVVQSASVAETEITDYIILSMTFNDDTDQITAEFSLNGGGIFQNPFTPIGWGMETSGGYGWYIGAESWELIPMTVSIDIKPGSYPNCFNNDGHGVIPVAILTTDTFDAATVDPFSVTLDGMGVRIKGKSGNAGSLEDVDGDGDLDLVLQIEDVDAVYAKGDTVATLSGETIDGIAIQGQDTICIVP